MAEYTIMADVSSFICNMLREKMCPKTVHSPNHIRISSPASRDKDYIIGVYLYDVKEETIAARLPGVPAEGTAFTKAPVPYSLSYMVFVNGSFRMGLKEPDIQKIIGRVAQIINDNNIVNPQEIHPRQGTAEPPITLSQVKMELDEKTQVWKAVNKPYQISLFYKAAPVFVSSEIVNDPPRVRKAFFNLDMAKERGGDAK